MEKLIIKNVGPIEIVDINLSRVNVFMGPQSSGKSTVAKIISYCQWVEKRFLIDGEYKYNVEEQLLEFHRIGNSYFNTESFFQYSSDFVIISYSGKDLQQTITSKKTNKVYKKTKNIYIPSERNFVSAIPNLNRYNETNDNIMSFVYDWYSSKRAFTNRNTLSILNLGIKYYNNIDSDLDVLKLSNNKEILLQEGSSGLQSIIPLVLIAEYLSKEIYKNNQAASVRELDSAKKNILRLFEHYKHTKNENIENSHDTINETEDFIRFLKYSKNNFNSIINYHKTKFIIEEPEQNLFPTTQRDLVNYLFRTIVNNRKKHSLIITTHSPYILYSINNCLMGHNIKGELEKDEIESFESTKSWINPDEVSIYEVKEGKLISVKDNRTKTVTKHYFNEITKDIMDEYYNMLSFFSYEG